MSFLLVLLVLILAAIVYALYANGVIGRGEDIDFDPSKIEVIQEGNLIVSKYTQTDRKGNIAVESVFRAQYEPASGKHPEYIENSYRQSHYVNKDGIDMPYDQKSVKIVVEASKQTVGRYVTFSPLQHELNQLTNKEKAMMKLVFSELMNYLNSTNKVNSVNINEMRSTHNIGLTYGR